uniref:Uncharacterized protein n=1 Tax=Meloidogyne enterolobii TaxID=390850 RepID=A0A6V7WIF4_MELEN|nr:unnamed protein product [Meloidogyne enterolobii]
MNPYLSDEIPPNPQIFLLIAHPEIHFLQLYIHIHRYRSSRFSCADSFLRTQKKCIPNHDVPYSNILSKHSLNILRIILIFVFNLSHGIN